MSNEHSNPEKLPRFVRGKHTCDQVLPPVKDLIGDGHGILNFVDLEGIERKLDYRALVDLDPMPIPMPVDREGYGTVENSAHFWATGHGDWLNVCDAIERYLDFDSNEQTEFPKKKIRLLDFGCATARFLRHCWAFGRDTLDIWGCDFAPANVAWVKKHLVDDIKIFLNTDVPHLPFEDGYFDVVTAFSVLTHIDLMEDAWLLELRRITRPGGLLYLTIQNQATWNKVADRPGSLQHMLKANDVPGNLAVSEELFRAAMPQDRIVLRMSNDDIYNCNVWFTNQYIHTHWSRYFEIQHIADNAHTGYQSPVIMKPLARTASHLEPSITTSSSSS